jgi:hypothetical protein
MKSYRGANGKHTGNAAVVELPSGWGGGQIGAGLQAISLRLPEGECRTRGGAQGQVVVVDRLAALRSVAPHVFLKYF